MLGLAAYGSKGDHTHINTHANTGTHCHTHTRTENAQIVADRHERSLKFVVGIT